MRWLALALTLGLWLAQMEMAPAQADMYQDMSNAQTAGTNVQFATGVFRQPGAQLADGASWAVAKNGFNANLNAASGNQFVQAIHGGVTSATGPGSYERAGLLVQTFTGDPSDASGVPFRDMVGVSTRSQILPGNLTGRVWGLYSRGQVDTGADGSALGAEIAIWNNGSNQTALDTQTSKAIIAIVPAGTQPATVGAYIHGPNTVHYGFAVKYSNLDTANANARAFWLGVPGGGTEYFGVKKDGTVNSYSGYQLRGNPIAEANGHHRVSVNPAPALTACGTSPAISGDDRAGEVTMGSGSPTACTITFAGAYAAVPYCNVSWQSNLASMQYVTAADKITLTQTAASSNKVNYHCTARSGG